MTASSETPGSRSDRTGRRSPQRIVRPHKGRSLNFGSGLRWSTSGRPAVVRGLASHTILPQSSPLQSKTCMATLFASNHVPFGTSHEAGRL